MAPEDRRTELESLAKALAVLETQRSALGDELADSAMAPLRRRLALLADGVAARHDQAAALLCCIPPRSDQASDEPGGQVQDDQDGFAVKFHSIVASRSGRAAGKLENCLLASWDSDGGADGAEKAVAAALEIRHELDLIAAGLSEHGEDEPEPACGISIVTAEAEPAPGAGTGSIEDESPDMKARAIKLAKTARGASILLSEETWKLVRDGFECVELLIDQAGSDGRKVRAWLAGRMPAGHFRDTAAGPAAPSRPMIGRTAQLERMAEVLREASSPGSCALVVVAGEAGTGKARLVSEFLGRSLAEFPETVVLKGRSSPETRTTPYAAFRDMLAGWLGIPMASGAETALARIVDLTGGEMDTRKAERVARFMGFGTLDSSEPRTDEIELLAFFTAAFGGGSHLLVLEDIQWADDATLRLVEMLNRERPGKRFLAICTTRPVLFERAPRWGNPAAGHELIRLDLLEPRETRLLIEGLLPEGSRIAADFAQDLHKRSGGNPFHSEEAFRMVMAAGALCPFEGSWAVRPGTDLDSLIPDNLQGIIRNRLDSLPRSEREVLQAAAVFGRRFWDSAVAEVVGRSRAEVLEVLSGLEGRNVVTRAPWSSFRGCAEFRFRHSLACEAISTMLAAGRRRKAHSAAAEWLAKHSAGSPDSYMAVTAMHLERAEKAEESAGLFQQAAEAALARGDPRDALLDVDRALGLRGDLPARSRALLLVTRGRILERQGRLKDAEKPLQEALRLSRDSGFEAGGARALLALGSVFESEGRSADSEAAVLQALEKSRRSGDRPALAAALVEVARLSAADGYEHVSALLSQAQAIYREMGNRAGQARCRHEAGSSALRFGEQQDARKAFEEALSLYRALDDPAGESDSHFALSSIERKAGRLDESLRHSREALRISSSAGDEERAASSLSAIGDTLRESGKREEALNYYMQSLRRGAPAGDPAVSVRVLGLLAPLMLELEKPEGAALALAFIASHEETAGLAASVHASEAIESRMPILLGRKELDELVRTARNSSLPELVQHLSDFLERAGHQES